MFRSTNSTRCAGLSYPTKRDFLKHWRGILIRRRSINCERVSMGMNPHPMDRTALRTLWNDTIDAQVKDGNLHERAYSWAHPKNIA